MSCIHTISHSVSFRLTVIPATLAILVFANCAKYDATPSLLLALLQSSQNSSQSTVQTCATQSIAPGLVLFYSMNGNSNDSSGSNHGVGTGVTNVADRTGIGSCALGFVGTAGVGGSNVTAGSALSIGPQVPFTYMIRTYVTALGTDVANTGKGNGDFIIDRTTSSTSLVNLKISNGGKFVVSIRFESGANPTGGDGQGQILGPAVTLNTWAHHAIVRDFAGGNFLYYIDGVLIGTMGDAATDLFPPVPRLGDHVSFLSNFLSGRLDDFAISDQALSQAQIQTISSSN